MLVSGKRREEFSWNLKAGTPRTQVGLKPEPTFKEPIGNASEKLFNLDKIRYSIHTTDKMRRKFGL